MTPALRHYLWSMTFGITVTVLLAFGGFSVLVEIIREAPDLYLADGPGEILLRLPWHLENAWTFALFTGALLSLLRLVHTSEIVALKAIGFPIYGILLNMLPVFVFLAILLFLVSNVLAPQADRILAAESSGGGPVWLRQGSEIVMAGRVSPDGRSLGNIRILALSRAGDGVESLTIAGTGQREGQRWRLYDVEKTPLSGESRHYRTRLWESAIGPADFSGMLLSRRAWSLGEIIGILEGRRSAPGQRRIHELIFHRKFSALASSLMVLLIAAPIARGTRRTGVVMLVATSAGLGFAYFIINGLAGLAAETGVWPAPLAAWAPVTLFALAGATLLLCQER